MAATTPDLVLYQGVYDDLITLWDRLAGERLFFDCGASRNAYKHEGKKTLAYEIAEQMGWTAPDALVAPVAVGETFIAAHRGFAELTRLGWIPRPAHGGGPGQPRQRRDAGMAGKRAIEPLRIGYTVAEGLAAGDPGQKGDWVLRILRETGGAPARPRTRRSSRPSACSPARRASGPGPPASPPLPSSVVCSPPRPSTRRAICVILSETGLKTEAPPAARHAPSTRPACVDSSRSDSVDRPLPDKSGRSCRQK